MASAATTELVMKAICRDEGGSAWCEGEESGESAAAHRVLGAVALRVEVCASRSQRVSRQARHGSEIVTYKATRSGRGCRCGRGSSVRRARLGKVPRCDQEGAGGDAQAVDEADGDGTPGTRALEDARVPREEDVEVAVQAAQGEDDGDVACGGVERGCRNDEAAGKEGSMPSRSQRERAREGVDVVGKKRPSGRTRSCRRRAGQRRSSSADPCGPRRPTGRARRWRRRRRAAR